MPQDMDPTMFEEILEVPYVFNRLVAYKADLIHSATGYFGWDYALVSKRMAVVFFWKTGSWIFPLKGILSCMREWLLEFFRFIGVS